MLLHEQPDPASAGNSSRKTIKRMFPLSLADRPCSKKIKPSVSYCSLQLSNLESDTRSHRGRQRDLLHINAFRRSRLQRINVSIKAPKFPSSLSVSNEILPIGAWTTPALSTRNSTRPAFISCTAEATLNVYGPDFGIRHQAAWSEDSTDPTNETHHVGCCDSLVKV